MVATGYRSDHNIITINIQETQKNRGPGLWKFNDSLLVNEEYDELVQKVISNTVKQYAIPLYSTDFTSDLNNFQCIEFTISMSLMRLC